MIAVTPHSVVFNFDIRESLSPWGSPKYKGKPTRSKVYMGFFAGRNPVCCVPGCGLPSQLHHVVAGRSRNAGAGDFKIVNVCAKHHAEIGSNELFQQRHGVDFARIIESNLRAYAAHLNVTGSFDTFESFEIALLQAEKTYRRMAA